ncbi:MAG: CBS domain-containing protein [Kiritimatiellia bacterium]|jgi:CBS domain-containing protein
MWKSVGSCYKVSEPERFGVLNMNPTINDIMVRNVVTAEPHHTVERLRRLMEKDQLHAIPIVGPEGIVLGIVSATDLTGSVKGFTPAHLVMTERVISIPDFHHVEQAARLMRKHLVHHLVVMHEQRVVGILSSYDLLDLLLEPGSDSGDADEPAVSNTGEVSPMSRLD